MSRNKMDFDFAGASKPCGKDQNPTDPDPQKSCSGMSCHLYLYCDLQDKKSPWQKPVRAKTLPA